MTSDGRVDGRFWERLAGKSPRLKALIEQVNSGIISSLGGLGRIPATLTYRLLPLFRHITNSAIRQRVTRNPPKAPGAPFGGFFCRFNSGLDFIAFQKAFPKSFHQPSRSLTCGGKAEVSASRAAYRQTRPIAAGHGRRPRPGAAHGDLYWQTRARLPCGKIVSLRSRLESLSGVVVANV